MQFEFCGEKFAVSVVDNLVRDGVLCDGYFEPEQRRVLISILAADRKRTLFHELRHAWIFALGTRGVDAESDAIDVAAFADVVNDQLERNGGQARLNAMRPDVTPAREQDAKAMVLTTWRECPCGCRVLVGDIQNGEIEFNAVYTVHTIERWMNCETCGGLTVWKETATEDGTPLGTFLPTPKHLRGSQRAAWLRENAAVATH